MKHKQTVYRMQQMRDCRRDLLIITKLLMHRKISKAEFEEKADQLDRRYNPRNYEI
jgi:hypothetical protein